MKRIEKYIPIAINVVEDIILEKYHKVADEWDNCIANFGAAIRQMDLLTAVTAFTPASSNSVVPKDELMHCLARIILTSDNRVCPVDQTLLSMVLDRPTDKLLKREIIDAAIAFKLALRLFIVKTKDKEDSIDENN
jgi:hypothetical protein